MKRIQDYFAPLGVTVGEGKYHEEAVYGISLVYAMLFNEMSLYLEQFDLSPAKLNVLMVIRHQGTAQGISQVEIGKRLMVTESNMTRLLEKLGRQGLIMRSPLPRDRRVKLIKMTSKAIKLLDTVWPQYQENINRLASRLSKPEQQEISILLQKWLMI
jgi:DNA-binding MarR family transcriptional regulator